MEKCIYKGKEIYARDLYKYRSQEKDYEKEITQAGHNRELLCPCKECKLKIFYNRGTKSGSTKNIAPHFFHERNKEKCEYDSYFKGTKVRNEIEKEALHRCYEILKEKYPKYNISKEVKLVNRHWTDIVIQDENRTLAIEFKFKYKVPKYLYDLHRKYDEAHIPFITIVIDDFYNEISGNDFNALKSDEFYKYNGILTLMSLASFNKNEAVNLHLVKEDFSISDSEFNYRFGNVFQFQTCFNDLDLFDHDYCLDEFKDKFNYFVTYRNTEYQKYLQYKEERRLFLEKQRLEIQERLEQEKKIIEEKELARREKERLVQIEKNKEIAKAQENYLKQINIYSKKLETLIMLEGNKEKSIEELPHNEYLLHRILKSQIQKYKEYCFDLQHSASPVLFLSSLYTLEKKIEKQIKKILPLSCEYIKNILMDWQHNIDTDFSVNYTIINIACSTSKESLQNFLSVKVELELFFDEKQKELFKNIFSKQSRKQNR